MIFDDVILVTLWGDTLVYKKPRQCSQYCNWTTGWVIWGSNCNRTKRFSAWYSWIRASQYNSYRNSQQDATVYQNLLFNVYMKLNMFRATHRPSSGAQNCTSSIWFCIRERLLEVEVAGHWQRPATSTSNNLSRMQNQRLLVQFWAPDNGRCVARNMLSFI